MCGIIARLGADDTVQPLLAGLQNLEYRGYDSAGIAVLNGHGIEVRKRAGEVGDLARLLEDDAPTGTVGIGHTRWSTHGPPVDRNAHPHTGRYGQVAVVHNGVIENHDALRSQLEAVGHAFRSETDTEVIPRLFEEYLRDGLPAREAFRRTVGDLEGSYAIAAIVDGEHAVFGARRHSPLVVGLGEDESYLASDVPAFLERTDRVVYLEDGDVAELRPGEVSITDLDGNHVTRRVEVLDWDPTEIERGPFDHYMAKEIHAQPAALADAIQGRIDRRAGRVQLDEFDPALLDGVTSIQLVGCGTSYHAAVYGARLLRRLNVRARAIRASEYEDAATPVDGSTLTVGVTQSGETADTLHALRAARDDGTPTVAVTNVTASSVTRLADGTVYLRAGPEIGVAATKTFSSQAVTLTLLAHRLAEGVATGEPTPASVADLRALPGLPDELDRLLERSRAAAVAERYLGSEAYFFIGRGLGYPVAMEGALKFKEITYEHAEGFAAGELKHGPLALVTPRTPVVVVFNGDRDGKTLTNAKEVQTRGARVVAVAPDGHPALGMADDHLWIPDTTPALAGILANVQLQLLAYHAAARLGRPIDKPRNLAKCVTVD